MGVEYKSLLIIFISRKYSPPMNMNVMLDAPVIFIPFFHFFFPSLFLNFEFLNYLIYGDIFWFFILDFEFSSRQLFLYIRILHVISNYSLCLNSRYFKIIIIVITIIINNFFCYCYCVFASFTTAYAII